MDTRWNKKSKIYIAVKTVLWLIFLGAAVMALDYLAAIANRGIYMEDYSQSSEGFESDLTFAAQSVVQGIQENDMKQYVNTALVYAQTKDGKTYENLEVIFETNDEKISTLNKLIVDFVHAE